MNRDQLIKLATACATVSLFHEFYATVNSETIVFRVAVYDGQATAPVYTRGFDITSTNAVETIRDGASADLIEALRLHFNDAVMRSEGLVCLQDYVAGGSGKLETNEHGQMTHASDLEELRVGANEWVLPGAPEYYIGSDHYTL